MTTATRPVNVKDAMQKVTDKFIQVIEDDIKNNRPAFWLRPWKTSYPMNASFGNEYNGINFWNLLIEQMLNKYDSNLWATFNQIRQMGGKVIKGSKSVPVIFWKVINKETEETEEDKSYLVARAYHVFNLDQTTDCELPKRMDKLTTELLTDFTPVEKADEIINNYVEGKIQNQTPLALYTPKSEGKADKIGVTIERAFYQPSTDSVNIPPVSLFNSMDEYYSTVFHELIHSTGHPKRLNRLKENSNYYTDHLESYSAEELTAELGNGILCQLTGIDGTNVANNSVAYLRHWLEIFKNNPKELMYAAGRAHKAVNHIVHGFMVKKDN